MQPSCVHFSVASRKNLYVVIPGPTRLHRGGTRNRFLTETDSGFSRRWSWCEPRNDNMKFSAGRHTNSATDGQ